VAISGDERVKGAGSILRMPETSFNTTQAFNETFEICHVACKSQHTCQLANIACEKRCAKFPQIIWRLMKDGEQT
jgi:hypothetical protein